jgi:hypothetical protein
MSWLLFLDESGHDHRTMPYEVRGGVALSAGNLWPFVQGMQSLESRAFGVRLHRYQIELKGSKLLDKDRFKWAAQDEPMPEEERQKHCRGFLTKGLQKVSPSRAEFTAYGQACIEMATGVFELLRDHKAQLFAAAIPRGVDRPDTPEASGFLRKDLVFMLERYFYFLERKQEHGLLVMDEVEKAEDRRLVRRLESYYRKSSPGRYRASWIVPTPFFVASDMAYPVQEADLAIYCVNWGFRLPSRGMDKEARSEIAERFGPWLHKLQYRGEGFGDGGSFQTYGVVFVPDPYTAR